MMLPMGVGSFLWMYRPAYSWGLILGPLLMLLTGFRSAGGASVFFPFAFARCVQLFHFALLCIWSVYLQARA